MYSERSHHTATPAINVQNLTKSYGPVLAVNDVTFPVDPKSLNYYHPGQGGDAH